MKRIFLGCIFLVVATGTCFAGVPGFMKARMGTLQGEFYSEVNGPHARGIVSFFNVKGGPPPIVGTARRVPDMVTRTDEKGYFSSKLLPGQYYMGALVRDEKGGPGPPREGEIYFFAMGDKGSLRVFEVKKRTTTNAGAVLGTTPEHFKEFQDFVTLKGKVLGEAGKPVGGIMVTVKDKLESPRPKFISKRTGDDGTFEIKLPPGTYYVQARESLKAGRPRTGSYIGTYGKTPPEAVEGGEGGSVTGGPRAPGASTQGGGGVAIAIEALAGKTYDDIIVEMFKIPDPDETRKRYEDEARKRKEKDKE